MNVRINVWILTMFFLAIPTPNINAGFDADVTFRFKVFLEDEEIGHQSFRVSANDRRTRVRIDAQFDVKYWFVTAYSYRHNNTEVWEDGCLHMIRSQTNDNGKSYFVRGTFVDDRMKLETHGGSRTVEGCIKTFAYWDPDFMSSSALLNSQTGEMNRIEVKTLGEEVITVRTRPTPAIHYRILADKFSIDLWYSSTGDWLALESLTEDESRLRYELQ